MIKLFRLLRPYRIPIGFVLIFVFLQSLSDLYLPTLMSDIVDTGVIKGNILYIVKVGGFMLLVAAAGGACSIATSFLSSRVSVGFGKILRSKLFSHVEGFTLHEFDKIGTASLITRTTNDITQVQQVLTMMLRMMVTAPMMCIGGIIMAVSKDAKLSLVIILIIPILGGTIYLVMRKGIVLFKAIQIKLDTLNRILREALTGVRVIRSFNRTGHEMKRFDEANRDLTNTAIQVNKIMASMMPLMMVILNASTIAILWFGSIRINQGGIQVGDLMAFLQYAMQILFSFIMVSMMFIMVPRASASAARINEVLNMVPELKDPESDAQMKHPGILAGSVEFQNVTFSYPGAEQPALSDISFSTHPGQITAIIGGTGSGKSTLINLIARFYDVNDGSIRIDGVDIRAMTQETLRAKIGFVPQNAVLFTGSVTDNIRFGKESATDEELRHAAEIAQASEFILSMKDGFDSVISQGGSNLSGGQKQRLSIARAIVRKPQIYIFDDSFSALDFKTDAKLRSALRKETQEANVLIVAQRVSTVMDADMIVVLDEGKIVGIGNHHELMKTSDVYREIVSSQLTKEESA